MTVEVRRVRDDEELAAAFALRQAVFTGEQGVRPDADRDPHDDVAVQLVAVEDGGAVLGTCRVLIAGDRAEIGRLVVARQARKGGVGAALLTGAGHEARAAGARLIRLNAQVAAQPFYERGGYRQDGEPFVEEGIAHVVMERRIDG